jgi:hypothetical protein
VPATGLSSKSILEAGELSSSNCPDLTLHKKANRNSEATLMLAIRRITITLIRFYSGRKIIQGGNCKR